MHLPLRSAPLLLLVMLAAWPARGEVKLPRLFTPHMVLQRDMPVPVCCE